MPLPPLNALKAFETTARLGNIGKAADKLGVSASAVSQQICKLETFLETSLFTRQANQITITANGQVYFNEITQAFTQIAHSTEKIKQTNNQNTLRVTTFTSFATHWLLPRLPLFTEQKPTIKIEIITTPELQNLENENIDIGIRFGLGKHYNNESVKILSDKVAPVVTPELAKEISNIREIYKYTLLRNVGMKNHYENTWEDWLIHHDFSDQEIEQLNFQTFSEGNLNIAAVLNGQGVYLAHFAYAKDLIEQNRLVSLTPYWHPTEYGFYLVKSKFFDYNPNAKKFYNWIINQAQKFEQPIHQP